MQKLSSLTVSYRASKAVSARMPVDGQNTYHADVGEENVQELIKYGGQE